MSKTFPVAICSPGLSDVEFANSYPCTNFISQLCKTVWRLIPSPGLKLLTTTANNLGCRGAHFCQGTAAVPIYSVHGNKVYKLLGYTPTITAITGTISTSSGPVDMCSNKTHVMIVDGYAGYVIDFATDTLVTISDSNFPLYPYSCTFINSRFVCNGSAIVDIFRLSALNDPLTWTPLVYATAEVAGDHISGLVAGGDRLHVLGATTYQPFYPANGSNPFEAVNGGALPVGSTRGYYTWQYFKDSLFFVSSNHQDIAVYRIRGGVLQKISTPLIDQLLHQYTDVGLYGFCYTYQSQDLYEISSDNLAIGTTVVYNITSDSWSIFSSNVGGGSDKHRIRRAINARSADDYPIAYDYFNGKIYTMNPTYNQEDSVDITRYTSFTIEAGADRVFHTRLRVLLDIRHDSSSSYTLTATLYWSDNGGLSYSTGEVQAKAISSGTTGQRVALLFANLGMSENERQYVLIITGLAAHIIIRSADITVDKGGF